MNLTKWILRRKRKGKLKGDKMTWLKAEYKFGSLFSYRMPDFSSQYALSSPLPGPSTIKLAIVATAIETTGNVSYGEKVFNVVKNAQIKIAKPKRIAVSNCLIKRLKKEKNAVKVQPTFGIRGYVHFQEPLKIFIKVEKGAEEIKSLLKKIRRFGTSDSLAYCTTMVKDMEEMPPDDALEPVDSLQEGKTASVVIPVKDINSDPKIKFAHVNVYDDKSRFRNPLVLRYYLLPILQRKRGKNWIVYEIG